MSTSSREAHELLRLFKCVVDTGTDVLAAFAKVKLLPTFHGNFKLFLDDKKHEIFHMWQSKKLSCCECPPAGYNLKRKSHINTWIFQKIYDDSGLEERRHIVHNSGNVVQVCLHKYVSRNIAIDELDISVISFLLRNLAVLSQNETTSLDTITTTRSQVCHAYSMNCFPLIFLNTAWTALEHALVDLADPSYKAMTRKQIKYLRKVDLEKEEITELLKDVNKINIVLNELSEMQITNNNLIRNGFKTHESRIVEVKDELIQNQNMQFAEIREQIQELTAIVKVSLKQKTRRIVTQYATSAEKKGESYAEKNNKLLYQLPEQSDTDMTDVGECSTEVYVKQGATPKRQHIESFKTLLSRWSMQSETDMADASKCNTEVSSKQGAIPKRRHRDVNYTEKFKKLLFRWSTQSETDVAGVGACNTDVPIKQGAKPLGNHKDETEIVKENPALHIKKYSTGMEENGIEEKKAEESSKQNKQTKDRSQIHATCQVEGKNIDESAAVQSLSDSKNESPLDLEFNITSAKRKCILLELEVPTKVLEDKQLFRVALRALIVKIARAGKVDFNKESTIILHLTFNDDLTEDIKKEIYEFSNHSHISFSLDRRLKSDQQSPNADWLRDKYARLVNENVTLKAENGHLLKEIYAQRETISNLKMEVNTYQKELFQMSEEQIRLRDEEQIRLRDEEQIRLRDEEQIRLRDEEQIRLRDEEQIRLRDEEQIRLRDEEQIKLRDEELTRFRDDNWKETRDSGYSDHGNVNSGYSDHMFEIQDPTTHGTSESKPERSYKNRSRPPSLGAMILHAVSQSSYMKTKKFTHTRQRSSVRSNFRVPYAANMENITSSQPNLAMNASFNHQNALHSHEKISSSDNGSPLPPSLKKPPPPPPSDKKHRRSKSEPLPTEVIHRKSICDPPPRPPPPEFRKTIALLSSRVGGEKAIRMSTLDVTPSPRRRAKSNSDDSKSSGTETASLPLPRKKKSPVGQKFQALFDCDAGYDDELTFAEGEIILVLREEENDWWEGAIEGHPERRGLFPKTFVQPLS